MLNPTREPVAHLLHQRLLLVRRAAIAAEIIAQIGLVELVQVEEEILHDVFRGSLDHLLRQQRGDELLHALLLHHSERLLGGTLSVRTHDRVLDVVEVEVARRAAASRLVEHRLGDRREIGALHGGLDVLAHVEDLLGDHFEELGAAQNEMDLLGRGVVPVAELHGEVVEPLDELGEDGEDGGGVVVIDEDVDEELGDGEDVREEVEDFLLHGEQRGFAIDSNGQEKENTP